MRLLKIFKDDVPEYLRKGTFFENLDSSDEDSFDVPSDCFKKDPSILDATDLAHVLRASQFWGLNEPPLTVVSFVVHKCRTLASEQYFRKYVSFLQCVFHVGQQKRKEIVFAAISMGLGLAVVKHLHILDGYPLCPKAFLAAVALDDLSSLKWLLSQGCTWHEHAVITILRYGSLECLKYALESGRPLCEGAITHAAMFQQLNVLQHLLAVGLKPESYVMQCAMQCVLPRGNLDVIRLLHQAGSELSEEDLITLVIYNHLDCLIYAHKSGCALSGDLCATAAGCGHLRCLEYLHLHGCPWDTVTLIMAAKQGHIACLRYAHQRGCALTPLVTTYALNHHRLDCLLYCMWHGALNRDLIKWCILSVSVVGQCVALWFTNQPTNTVLCFTLSMALYYTARVFDLSMSPRFAKVLRYVAVVVTLFFGYYTTQDLYNSVFSF